MYSPGNGWPVRKLADTLPSSSSAVYRLAWLSRAARAASVDLSIAAESWLTKSQPPRVNAAARARVNTSATRRRIDICYPGSS